MKKIAEKETKSTVKILREIRDKISLEIQDMNTEELLEYYRNRKTLHPTLAKIKRAESGKWDIVLLINFNPGGEASALNARLLLAPAGKRGCLSFD